MPSADTMMLLDEAFVLAVRLLASKLPDHDLVAVDQIACGQAAIAKLSFEPI